MFIATMASMPTKNVDAITPGQCKAARALLELTQGELADAAKLGLSTIVDFEKRRRQVSVSAIRAIKDALAGRGVEFIDENGGGPGVRLRKRSQRK
jgi:predicted transcriptional regulator